MCRDAINKRVNHETVQLLGNIMIGFLIASMITNLFSAYVVSGCDSVTEICPTIALGVDAFCIFMTLVFCVYLMNYASGPYLKGIKPSDFKDMEMVGYGFWMLLAMLIIRVISNPRLLFCTIVVLLPIALIFFLALVRTKGFFSVVGTAVEAEKKSKGSF
ncbi:uncharacterized protein BKA55DRAFT_575968 [Fusarium redolens]|uniref:Uncharacterized protein n=1 Tax=Fusarium redolens TaxID=48865 RepID=A0A9P9K5H9_FUSRE|nr:uncharacterized protein BKA55DRAFT_575968 [Fusarium redolens]KAH7240884.1 hypothetical protein BKA55DRAFT_575968 [Fusarium redolens]